MQQLPLRNGAGSTGSKTERCTAEHTLGVILTNFTFDMSQFLPLLGIILLLNHASSDNTYVTAVVKK